jgi:hypothetical protein
MPGLAPISARSTPKFNLEERGLDHVRGNYAGDFIKSCLSCKRAGEAILPEGAHPLTDRYIFKRGGGKLLQDGLAKWFGNEQQFRDRQSPLKTGIIALFAAFARAKLRGRDQIFRHEL